MLCLRFDVSVNSRLNFVVFILWHGVTTCLENVEMSGNLTSVREMLGI